MVDKKQVQVSFVISITEQNQRNTYKGKAFGELTTKGDLKYLRYIEKTDSGEVTNVWKIGSGHMTILRNGEVSVRQQLHIHTKTEGSYSTPYGTLNHYIETTRLKVMWGLQGEGRIEAAFTTILDEETKRLHEVLLEIKEGSHE
ncbi:DUF1934 domain-containing protein [Alkalihalobacillus sp. LMS39]|uniref:DUF1934 domain-containing protein n=1 Tax=Alkalihalobacillus sp. LMS39 TaxID=2924032 RepID=UPI001FB3CFC8|nr:DUF1934 domain-containing protein [Alkalihalobacillus sp. LMS39]UOE93988.1 DUF1934 domain-containing protein [Alkalihalobacillus sp. LMS39]